MIILQLQGGLGNQMFIYAVYRKLIKMFPDRVIKLDTTHYKYFDKAREIELKRFGIDYEVATSSDIRKILGYNPNNLTFWGKVMRRCFSHGRITVEEEFNDFLSDDIYLSGYFQNEKYFKDIRGELLEAFSFSEGEDFPRDYIDILDDIRNTNSCSLHLRRGDYLEFEGRYGGICTPEYYDNAISFMLKSKPDIQFFVFSDDAEFGRNYAVQLNEKYNRQIAAFVPSECTTTGFYDLYLMSECRNHIMANSSFSWWGAWLGENDDKMVLSPNKWFSDKPTTSMICDDWIRIV